MVVVGMTPVAMGTDEMILDMLVATVVVDVCLQLCLCRCLCLCLCLCLFLICVSLYKYVSSFQIALSWVLYLVAVVNDVPKIGAMIRNTYNIRYDYWWSWPSYASMFLYLAMCM